MKETTQKLAIDIGSGDTKYYFKDHQDKDVYGKFPSAVGRSKKVSTSFGKDTSVVFEGVNYLIGNDAVDSAISSRTLDYQIKYSPLLAYKAILMANFDLNEPIELHIGVTIKDWDKCDELENRLNGIMIDGMKLKTSVKSLYAQGQGSFIDEGSPAGIVVIVDGGYNTLDFLAFKDRQPDAQKCFATTYGANKMITNLQAIVSKEYNAPVTEQSAKELFNKKHINIFGEKKDLTEIILQEQEAYLEELFLELHSRQGDVLKMADEVIFTGGLAYFLEGAELPANARLGKKPYEYSNVRGYYHG